MAYERSISVQDPATLIAGIKQFGLAPDGSDLRDLEASVAALQSRVSELKSLLQDSRAQLITIIESETPTDFKMWLADIDAALFPQIKE